MSFSAQRNELLVLEYGGTARSGKGTLVSHLAENYDGVATEETGADYRAVTRALITDGALEHGMTPKHIERQVRSVGTGALTEMVANRNSLVTEVGLPSLYLPDVTDLVGHVSPLAEVRKAVKSGFTKRVEAVRDDNEHNVLLVDGRNLGPVIETVPGTSLLMRTFVSCAETEAAIRECYRKGLQPRTDEWNETFVVEYNRILARNKLDAERTVDPVRPDDDAIDYWWDNEVMRISATRKHIDSNGLDRSVSDNSRHLMKWLTEKPHHKQQLRRGIGSIACRDGRQINFDTSVYRGHFDDPRGEMLTAARTMFEEALGGDHLTDLLTQRVPMKAVDLSQLDSHITAPLVAALRQDA